MINIKPEVILAGHRPELPGILCAGLPDHWWYAARMKYAQDIDTETLNSLRLKMFDIAIKIKTRLDWRATKGTTLLWRMVNLALLEMADPARFKDNSAWKLKQQYLGVGKSQWYEPWAGRYEVLFQELDDWGNRAYRYIQVKGRRSIREAHELVEAFSETEQTYFEKTMKKVG